jgi:putative heme iron utilization protein
MLESPRVSLLVIAKTADDVSPQATPRVTIQGDANQLERSSGEYAAARKSYLSRFPDSEGMFELGDFSLFLIIPASALVIGGFGSAATISGADLATSLRGV